MSNCCCGVTISFADLKNPNCSCCCEQPPLDCLEVKNCIAALGPGLIYSTGTNLFSLTTSTDGVYGVQFVNGIPVSLQVGGSGSGSVTSVDAQNLSPLFTTTVTNPTTTPNIVFTPISQTASTVYAAPDGSNGTPAFRLLNFDELGDTFTYPGNKGGVAMVNGTETGLIPLFLFTGTNFIAVDMVTTANITLSGIQNLDGQTGSVGKKVLVWQNTSKIQNGVYDMAAGAWTRDPDADTSAELDNEVVFANYKKAGSTYGGAYFNQIVDTPTIGVDDIIYELGIVGGKKTAWLTTGNPNILSTSKFGSINAADVRIHTTNIQRGSFFSSGEFGWGITSTPSGTVHIKGLSSQSPLYVINNAGTHSWENRNDGSIYRDGSLWSIPAVNDSNVSWGDLAGQANGGLNNTYLGSSAGILNTGSSNVFVGHNAGLVFTSGVQSTLIGTAAGAGITTGGTNTCIGYHAGEQSGGTGTGFSNTIIGNNTGRFARGNGNILLGSELGNSGFVTGDSNIVISNSGLLSSNNVQLCVIVGHVATANGISNSIGIGHYAALTANNQLVMGSPTVYLNQEQHFWSASGIHGTYYRTSTPEGAQAAQQGSVCYVNDGTNGMAYLKTTLTGNTGWSAFCMAPCGGASVTALTVSAAQALALASGFTEGALYQITDAYSSTAVINIKAYSTSVLEDYGFGTFRNATMIAPAYCQIWYDLVGDLIYRIYESIYNNDISTNTLIRSSIDNFKFGNSSNYDNQFENVDLVVSGTAIYTMHGNTAKACTITTIGNDDSPVILDTFIDTGASVTIQADGDAPFLHGCVIGKNATLSISKDHQFTNCTIGNGKTIDTANIGLGYHPTGKVYDGDRSTFEVTSTDDPNVDPSGGVISMANCAFAGYLFFDVGDTLVTFSNYPADHSWILLPKVGGASVDVVVQDNALGAGNIYLEVSGTSITINRSSTPGDYLQFQQSKFNLNFVEKIAGFIRS